MKVVIQRVKSGSVKINNKIKGKIDYGMVILLGVADDDNEEDAKFLAEKCVNLRIFRDENEKMNLSLLDINGEILSISQFTLYADTRKGRRPSFIKAANPEKGEYLYKMFNNYLQKYGIKVETGEFGAMMDVELINDGPVTIIIDS
ncbi:D-tyrosyl-tRNA(Tyr) deacylase, partial [candidate division KSB1 bacterium]